MLSTSFTQKNLQSLSKSKLIQIILNQQLALEQQQADSSFNVNTTLSIKQANPIKSELTIWKSKTAATAISEVSVNEKTRQSHNYFEYIPAEKDKNSALTAIRIGYSSIAQTTNGRYPSPMIKSIERINLNTKKTQNIKAHITWAKNGCDIIPFHTLKLCDGINEWVNEVTIYSGYDWNGAKYFLFKTNKGRVIHSYDQTKAKQIKNVKTIDYNELIKGCKLKEVITPPNAQYKLSGIYGCHGYVIDCIGFTFVGPKRLHHRNIKEEQKADDESQIEGH